MHTKRRRKEVPNEWHLAQVSAIHKKGRTDSPENYRPISLLCVAYKAFAALIQKRLVKAGAEDRLSNCQFGFRSKFGTADAVFVLRRRIELAWAQRSGKAIVLALDWQRAFDSIDPGAMLAGLQRFGLPTHVLQIVEAIYKDRRFEVKDRLGTSQRRSQGAGISQGCPLSPFLFIMLMTVVMADAVSMLPDADKELVDKHELAALLYADDTLLIGVHQDKVEKILAAIEQSGANFGLELHANKFHLLNIRCQQPVRYTDGRAIQAEEELVYLGALISNDGRIRRELVRRLGTAHADFRALSQIWRHASINRRRKVEIYNATIVSKLTYGLATAWLNTAERRRLNGFQNRCLRKIWGIRPSHLSHISNKSVLATTEQKLLTHALAKQQLLLFAKAARAPEGSLLRDSTFCPGSLRAATDRFVRKVGRPRLEWVGEVWKMAIKVAGSSGMLNEMVTQDDIWKNAVTRYCSEHELP
jgi:hypothetical protein